MPIENRNEIIRFHKRNIILILSFLFYFSLFACIQFDSTKSQSSKKVNSHWQSIPCCTNLKLFMWSCLWNYWASEAKIENKKKSTSANIRKALLTRLHTTNLFECRSVIRGHSWHYSTWDTKFRGCERATCGYRRSVGRNASGCKLWRPFMHNTWKAVYTQVFFFSCNMKS